MSVIGLNVGLLTGWYQSRINASLVSSSPLAQASGSRANSGNDVLPPWDVNGDVQSLEDMRRKVLASGLFFKDPTREFSDLDAPGDHKSLFSLYQGLKRMLSLAEEAKEKSTSDIQRDFLQRNFTSGVAQLDSYFDGMDLTELTLLKGEQLSKAESDVAISRGVSQFTSGIIHSGAFDAEVASLTGDVQRFANKPKTSVQFTVSVTKNGVQQDIAINLADMGATTRNLDNIATHINTQLEAAGMVTRFERTKIGVEDDNGIVQGNDFGFLIKGVSTESVSFSAPAAQPALYFAGVSGINDTAGGQVVKLTDLASGTPTTDYSTRFSADPNETEVEVVGSEDGETRLKLEDNPLEIQATAAAADGGIFVVGHTTASADGQEIKGEQDLVLAKYDSLGNRVWSRVLGAAETAEGASIAVDADGNVVVSGQVTGGLGETTDIGGSDAIVAKYNSAGVEQWVQRFGGTGDDTADTLTVADDGTVYVGGSSETAFGGDSHGGGATDGYVRAIGADGTTLYTRRIALTQDEIVSAIAVMTDGNIVIASEENGDAVLRKYNSADDTSAAMWEQNLGSLDGGRIEAVVVDGNDVYLTGAAGAGFSPSAPVGAHAGGVRDAFVVKMSDGASPTVAYTTFVGSDADDSAAGIQIHNGKVYIAGKTLGGIDGNTLQGERDAFAAQIDAATGTLDWASQFSGRGGLAEANGLAIQAADDSVLDALGLPTGTLTYSDTRVITDRSSAREGDYFYLSVDGGRRKKISLESGDTIRSLTFKINAALVLDGTSDVRRSSEGDRLRIKAAEGKTIELFAGGEGRDLLKALGMAPGAIVNTGSLLDKDTKTPDGPPLFALDLPVKLSLASLDDAQAAYESLENAISMVQRAYRELTTDPALKALLEGPKAGKRGGTVPGYLSAQLANYQAGLSRLNSGGGTSAYF